MLRRLLLPALLATLVLAPAAQAACPDPDLSPEPANLPRVEAATVCLLNEERAVQGLPALADNPLLAAAGRRHVRAMIDLGFFAHEGRDGSTIGDRIRAAGYLAPGSRWVIGENLAWGTGVLATPRSIVAAWMASPGHRANILHDEFAEIGIAAEPGVPDAPEAAGATFATEFGLVESGSSTTAAPAPGTALEPAAAPATSSAASARTTPPAVVRRTRRTCRTKRHKRTRPCRAPIRRAHRR